MHRFLIELMCIAPPVTVASTDIGLLPGPDAPPRFVEEPLVVRLQQRLTHLGGECRQQGGVGVANSQVALLAGRRDLVGAEREAVRVAADQVDRPLDRLARGDDVSGGRSRARPPRARRPRTRRRSRPPPRRRCRRSPRSLPAGRPPGRGTVAGPRPRTCRRGNAPVPPRPSRRPSWPCLRGPVPREGGAGPRTPRRGGSRRRASSEQQALDPSRRTRGPSPDGLDGWQPVGEKDASRLRQAISHGDPREHSRSAEGKPLVELRGGRTKYYQYAGRARCGLMARHAPGRVIPERSRA